jgi:two-component system phosphate regulon sensor histidine kinase PhoR
MIILWVVVCLFALTTGFLLGVLSRKTVPSTVLKREPSQEQLLSWLDLAPLGWLVVGGSNHIWFINTRAQRLLQLSTSVPPPQLIQQLKHGEVLNELVEDVRFQQTPKRLEWDYADQELEVFAFPGEQRSVAIAVQSRRSLVAQLNQQERWVSDVAHELKTPLTALLLVGDSLASSVTDQNAVLVERLLKELRRMRELVADLLELTRLENVLPGSGMALQRIEIDVLINEAWHGIKPLADEKSVSLYLRTNNDAGLDEVVYGDRTRLHRALLNLMDNAVRFSPAGSRMEVDIDSSGDWLRIGIRDYGPGLSEQDLEHMFERFYRGDISRCRGQRGASGLGLAIVQQIILTHGGWIFGENAVGGGARFVLRLPTKFKRSNN